MVFILCYVLGFTALKGCANESIILIVPLYNNLAEKKHDLSIQAFSCQLHVNCDFYQCCLPSPNLENVNDKLLKLVFIIHLK